MYLPSITVDRIIETLGGFIAPFVPGGQVIRAQVNRVPMPSNPCVILTELFQRDLQVSYSEPDPVNNVVTIKGSRGIDIQIDFYGASAGDYCTATKLALRSDWGWTQFPADIKPLDTSDGIQSPLITGEEQWESRWTLTAKLQYNPDVEVPQQFADEANVTGLIAADVLY